MTVVLSCLFLSMVSNLHGTRLLSKRSIRRTHQLQSMNISIHGAAYFYYLQHRAVTMDLDWDTLWRKEIDVDGSGYLDENELLTLASMALGKEPTVGNILINCMVQF